VHCKGLLPLLLQRFAYDYRCLKGDVEQGDARNEREGEVVIEIKPHVASPSGASTPGQRTHGRGIRLPVALTVVSHGGVLQGSLHSMLVKLQ